VFDRLLVQRSKRPQLYCFSFDLVSIHLLTKGVRVPLQLLQSHDELFGFSTTDASVSYIPCAVILAFTLFRTGFPHDLIHIFVFISVFRFDFGGFFLFITVNRIWWLAKLDWTFQECNLLCWGCLV